MKIRYQVCVPTNFYTFLWKITFRKEKKKSEHENRALKWIGCIHDSSENPRESEVQFPLSKKSLVRPSTHILCIWINLNSWVCEVSTNLRRINSSLKTKKENRELTAVFAFQIQLSNWKCNNHAYMSPSCVLYCDPIVLSYPGQSQIALSCRRKGVQSQYLMACDLSWFRIRRTLLLRNLRGVINYALRRWSVCPTSVSPSETCFGFAFL